MRSVWVPFSLIEPFFRTKMISQFLIVDNLWAIIIHVRPCWALSNAIWTNLRKRNTYKLNYNYKKFVYRIKEITLSDSLSKAEVASSSNKISGFFIKALAIQILCFCPPLKLFVPFVWYPCGRFIMKSWMFACLAASIISSNLTFLELSPYAIFSAY